MDEAVLKEDSAARGQYILSKNTLRSSFYLLKFKKHKSLQSEKSPIFCYTGILQKKHSINKICNLLISVYVYFYLFKQIFVCEWLSLLSITVGSLSVSETTHSTFPSQFRWKKCLQFKGSKSVSEAAGKKWCCGSWLFKTSSSRNVSCTILKFSFQIQWVLI